MALTREKKEQIVAEVAQLLQSSKMTVVAKYAGTSVKSMQALKRASRDNGTTLKVVKNRLVIKALSDNAKFAGADTNRLSGQLLYAFNAEDEVAPAQVLANFAKNEPQLEFVGALTADGSFISAEDVKALAGLPSKDQLRAQLVGMFAAPMSGFVNVMASNVRGVLNVLSAHSEAIS